MNDLALITNAQLKWTKRLQRSMDNIKIHNNGTVKIRKRNYNGYIQYPKHNKNYVTSKKYGKNTLPLSSQIMGEYAGSRTK